MDFFLRAPIELVQIIFNFLKKDSYSIILFTQCVNKQIRDRLHSKIKWEVLFAVQFQKFYQMCKRHHEVVRWDLTCSMVIQIPANNFMMTFTHLVKFLRVNQPKTGGFRWDDYNTCMFSTSVIDYRVKGKTLDYLSQANGNRGKPLINEQWVFMREPKQRRFASRFNTACEMYAIKFECGKVVKLKKILDYKEWDIY
jgi:hypothetical protein